MSKFLVLVIGSVIAFLILRYRRPLKEFTGDIGFAEKYLGSGGTNTFIVLLGVAVFILSLMYSLGTLQSILDAFAGPFFGRL